jgi:parvulin-like peptidyl-prolyl isomerase
VTKRPRILVRTTPLLVMALVGLGACGSSSAVSSPSDVVTVDGKGYPKTQFDEIAADLIKVGQFKAANGVLAVADARTLIRTLIEFEAFNSFLKDRGLSVDDADRSSTLEQANADAQFSTYSEPLQELLIELSVASLTLDKVKAPSESEVQDLYGASPASVGVLCLSHILVKTEAEARSVLGELDKGADFAKLAKAKSIEPAAKQSGGALKNGDEECSSLRDLQSSFDKDFLSGAVAAKPGTPTGPVKSSFGYHVILSHPFAEVKDSVMRVVTKDPGNTLLNGYLTTVDVKVNSKYGRWNPALATIE